VACALRIQVFVQHSGFLPGAHVPPRSAIAASNPHRTPSRAGRLGAFFIAGLCISVPVQASLIVHDANDVLRHYTKEDGGRLYFMDPDGSEWEMVTRIDDPAILYKGGGAFFPADRAFVDDALASIQYPLGTLDGDVFILPYPRRAMLDSEARGRAVIVSPGVWPLGASQVHMLVAHEVGHLVQHAFMPDGDRAAWSTYRDLRDIEDARTYCATAMHRDRPHEIFAEDFRVLFGGGLAAGSGRVENPYLAPPEDVPELGAFFFSLMESRLPIPVGRIVPLPNPAPAGSSIGFSLSDVADDSRPVEISVFDVEGRRVTGMPVQSGVRTSWNGRLENGSAAPPGLYFLRAEKDGRAWTGKLLVAR